MYAQTVQPVFPSLKQVLCQGTEFSYQIFINKKRILATKTTLLKGLFKFACFSIRWLAVKPSDLQIPSLEISIYYSFNALGKNGAI